MTGLEYEKLVAKYLRRHGYYRVSVTRGSGDFGIDVIAHKGNHKYAVQCKYYNSAVSLDAVQEAVAGMAYYKCDRAMVVTNSTYTKAAKELAKCNGVVLLDGVTSAGLSISSKFIKWLLIAAYILVMSAAVSAAFDVIKTQPFWQGLYDLVTIMFVFTAPFGIWLLYRMIKKKIAKRNNAEKESVVTTTIEKHTNTETIITTPEKYANAEKVYKFLTDNDYTISMGDVEKLVMSKTITISRVQRTLKYGYARAARLLDMLLENDYVLMIGNSIYQWDYRAK